MHFITRRARDPTKIDIPIVEIRPLVFDILGLNPQKLLSQQFLGDFELQYLKNCKPDCWRAICQIYQNILLFSLIWIMCKYLAKLDSAAIEDMYKFPNKVLMLFLIFYMVIKRGFIIFSDHLLFGTATLLILSDNVSLVKSE